MTLPLSQKEGRYELSLDCNTHFRVYVGLGLYLVEGRTATCEDHGMCWNPGSIPGGDDGITQQWRANEVVEVHNQLVHPMAGSCDT